MVSPSSSAKLGRPDRGAVLVLALLVMMTLLLFGVAYLEQGTNYVGIQAQTELRLRARALAEGAIDLGYQTLVDQPDFRGRLPVVSDSDGQFEIGILSAGSEVDVVAIATVGNIKQALRSRASPDQPASFDGPFEISGQVQLDRVLAFDWTGTLRYRSSWGSVLSTTSGTRVLDSGLSGFQIDQAALAANATQTYTGDQTFSNATLSGLVRVEGNVFLQGSLTVNGILWVTGELGGADWSDIEVRTVGESSAVIVGGNVRWSRVNNLSLVGTFVVKGQFAAEDLDTVRGNGALFVENDLSLRRITAIEWQFPTTGSSPGYVTGIGRWGAVRYTEKWIRAE